MGRGTEPSAATSTKGQANFREWAKLILRWQQARWTEEASTHSFRRTCLTQMHCSGVPLKVIQKISGHKTLSALQKYLEVLDEDLESAISTLKFWT